VVLSKSLLAVIVGVRRAVTTEEVAMALETVHGLEAGTFCVHCHKPEDFLLYFTSREDRDRVLRDEVLASPYFPLLLLPWPRRMHAASGGLYVHTEVEIEGIPANSWSLTTAETVLAPSAWVKRLHPLTRRHGHLQAHGLVFGPGHDSAGGGSPRHRARRTAISGGHGGANGGGGASTHQHLGISAARPRD
jgi:uncharacterized membrane protein YgcG